MVDVRTCISEFHKDIKESQKNFLSAIESFSTRQQTFDDGRSYEIPLTEREKEMKIHLSIHQARASLDHFAMKCGYGALPLVVYQPPPTSLSELPTDLEKALSALHVPTSESRPTELSQVQEAIIGLAILDNTGKHKSITPRALGSIGDVDDNGKFTLSRKNVFLYGEEKDFRNNEKYYFGPLGISNSEIEYGIFGPLIWWANFLENKINNTNMYLFLNEKRSLRFLEVKKKPSSA